MHLHYGDLIDGTWWAHSHITKSFITVRVIQGGHLHTDVEGILELGNFSIVVHCWAFRHSQGFEDKDLGSSPGLLGQ